jgi:hypothetical protein
MDFIHRTAEGQILSAQDKKKIITTVLTAVKKNKQPTHTPGGPGRLRSWSGPVDPEFQGRLRFSYDSMPGTAPRKFQEEEADKCSRVGREEEGTNSNRPELGGIVLPLQSLKTQTPRGEACIPATGRRGTRVGPVRGLRGGGRRGWCEE